MYFTFSEICLCENICIFSRILPKTATEFVQYSYNTADFAHMKLKYLKFFTVQVK
jgi:hypothetical protein